MCHKTSFTCKAMVTILRHQMSWGMTSHVHHIVSKDRYRVALPSDGMHHWQTGHESPVCIALDNTHLYCNYDQCCQQCGCRIPSHTQATGYHHHHIYSFLNLTPGGWLNVLCLSLQQPFTWLPSGQWRRQPQWLPVLGLVFQSQLLHLQNQRMNLWGLTNCNGIHTGSSAPSGKTQACPRPHIRTGLGPCHLPVSTFFQRTQGLTVSSCDCQCLSGGVKPCYGQLKKIKSI
jgi:hypothetical protein